MRKPKYIFAFSIISRNWDGTGTLNRSSWKERALYRKYITSADDLAEQGVRVSRTRARFLSLARSKLSLCSANHRPGYWSNPPCDWPSTAWAYSEQETENGPRVLVYRNVLASVPQGLTFNVRQGSMWSRRSCWTMCSDMLKRVENIRLTKIFWNNYAKPFCARTSASAIVTKIDPHTRRDRGWALEGSMIPFMQTIPCGHIWETMFGNHVHSADSSNEVR